MTINDINEDEKRNVCGTETACLPCYNAPLLQTEEAQPYERCFRQKVQGK